jgi:ABC-type ATPase involved in cell division
LKQTIKKFRDKYVSHADINKIEKLNVPYLSKGVEMVFISYEIFSIKNRIYNKNLKLEFEQIYKDIQNLEKSIYKPAN